MLRRPYLLALLVASSLAAQETAGQPRLGLVLSGGGARGLAHVGVLEVLEELRVPVDCVAGTSMGAIIGGLYAYGMDANEIREAVLAVDWPYVLQDSPDRNDLSIRRKQDEFEFLIPLRLGFRDGAIAFPKGLVQGQNLGIVLDQLAIDAHDVESFDRLPLPFRCVATDIGDGSRVVFDRGDLPRAMRASMALPGVFAPVEWQGRMLIDGGIIDNLPVRAAREMGAERVIAVDIGTPLMKPEEIRDLFGITSQMLGLYMQRYVDEAIALIGPEDLLLQPELGELSVSDFQKAAELIELGREWARRNADALQRYAVSEAEFARFRERHRREQKPLPIVAGIEVHGCERFNEETLKSRLSIKVGDRLDLHRLKRDLERVYGLDFYELVRCRVLMRDDGANCTLDIDAVEKSWGPGQLLFGLDAGTDFSGGDSFSVGVHLVQTGIGSLDAEWATTIRLGTNTLLSTEWFQPLDHGRTFFVAPRLAYERRPLRAPFSGQISQFIGDEASAAIDVGTHWQPWSELRFGIDRGFGSYDVTAGLTPPGSDRVDDGGLHARYLYDTLDRAIFPSEGVRATAEWRLRETSLGADSNYEVASLEGGAAVTVFDQTFALLFSGQWELDGQVAFVDLYQIGGLFRLSGLGSLQLVAPEGGVATLATYRRLSESSNPLTFPVYLGATIEFGGVWDWSSIDSDEVLVACSAFVGFDSPLGPILVAVGATEGGEHAAYLTVGQFGF